MVSHTSQGGGLSWSFLGLSLSFFFEGGDVPNTDGASGTGGIGQEEEVVVGFAWSLSCATVATLLLLLLVAEVAEKTGTGGNDRRCCGTGLSSLFGFVGALFAKNVAAVFAKNGNRGGGGASTRILLLLVRGGLMVDMVDGDGNSGTAPDVQNG